jgi:hypothetical protein
MPQPNDQAMIHAAGGGGFGGPPPGGYGPPQGGFGAPPQGGDFGAPPGGFGAPPGGYGAPPGGYGAPGGFGAPPQGPYGAPGPYGPPGGPYGAPPAELQAKVDRWFILSIVSIFCGCGVLGIVPILISNNAKEALRNGNFAKAESDIGTAKLLCILGYVAAGLALVFYLIYFVFILGVFASMH